MTGAVARQAGGGGYGQVGEITVRSPYLSGYWRQPELTGARFAADAAAPNKTIYRSGDMGYMLPDGCLVHLGRNDLQVKVRGHRVNLDVSSGYWRTSGGTRSGSGHSEPPDDIREVAVLSVQRAS
jgi:acyl-CoA synthetase (AMP-forming)/AMP-acid ligase II